MCAMQQIPVQMKLSIVQNQQQHVTLNVDPKDHAKVQLLFVPMIKTVQLHVHHIHHVSRFRFIVHQKQEYVQ